MYNIGVLFEDDAIEINLYKNNKKNDKPFYSRGYSFFFLNGHLSEASVINSKYIKMTGLQDFY